jgi:hypothetical protein
MTTQHRRGVVELLYGVKRWMYRRGRPGLLARVMNRISAVQFSAGVLSAVDCDHVWWSSFLPAR